MIKSIQSYNTFKNLPKNTSQNESKKDESFLDKFKTGIVNSADMNDTIQVPRTIFKGYLAFTAGTAFVTLAMVAKKFKTLSNILNVASAGLVIYGTYSFVRPYLIKGKAPVAEIKK